VIIDALSSFVPEPEAFAAAQVTLARLDGYLEHFDPAAVAGKDKEQIKREMAAAGRALCPSEDAFFAMLDRSKVDKAAIYNELYATSLGVATSSNDAVARYVAKRPSRLFGVGGVDPWDEASIADMDRSVRELGMRAFILSPFKQKLFPTDARLGRVFGKCEALGVPIMLHTGINWWRGVDYDIGHPRYIDGVANAYPKLKILAVHCAWPWVMDMMMVAWRHPNVFVDISAHRPKHFMIQGAGWEPLMQYGTRMLADKIIFASTWTLLAMSIESLIGEVRALPMKDGVADKWLGLNAARFFDLG
jgi:uncharacterized protein